MNTYTISWHHKVDGKWKRSSTMFVAEALPTLEETCKRISGVCNPVDAHNVQLEEGDPALQYVTPNHKRKNTNAWKPKRYGK